MIEYLKNEFKRAIMRDRYITAASRTIVQAYSMDSIWQGIRPLIVYNTQNPTDATVALENCLRVLEKTKYKEDLFYLATKILQDPIAHQSFVARQKAMWWVTDSFVEVCNDADRFKERAAIVLLAADVHGMAVNAGAGGAMHAIKIRIEEGFAQVMPAIEEAYNQRDDKPAKYMDRIRECAQRVEYYRSAPSTKQTPESSLKVA